MTDLHLETVYFERLTVREVQAACEQVLHGMKWGIQPSMFDASVIVRHAPDHGPTIDQADRIADLLREGRPLMPDRADWHATGVSPYTDALDASVVYGSIFGLVRAFLPRAETLERLGVQ